MTKRWDTKPFTQPKQMSSFEKGIWIGVLIGIVISNLIWFLLIK